MGQCQYLGESRPGETERVNRFWTGNLAWDLTMRSYFIRLTWGRGDKLSEEQASDVPQEPYEAWGRREGFRWGGSAALSKDREVCQEHLDNEVLQVQRGHASGKG